jgi:hypothetical protein
MIEPNGTLVMTTCQCRENNKNLVMTRTWFEEQLQNKIQQGRILEHERIVELLMHSPISAETYKLIQLLKGNPND